MPRLKGGNMKVENIMTTSVEFCSADDNLATVAGSMWDHNCGALPVTDDAGRVTGIITDRDIAIAVGTRGVPASEITVGTVMSGNFTACIFDEDVESALTKMAQERVRRLPV